MNKQMRDLMGKIEAKRKEAQELLDKGGKAEETKAVLAEIKDLQGQYEVAKELYDAEKATVPEGTKPEGKEDGFAVIAKLLRKKSLTEAENALISGDNAADGENYLIPEDVDVTIRELRKKYVSAKSLLTNMSTESLAGSFVFESGTPVGLTSFDDGDDIPAETNPTFTQKKFAIGLMGKLIPISNILRGAEKAGLMQYINNWFVKNAIISENSKIFTVLKTGKTAKAIKGLQALKTSLNKDLDPSVLYDAVIVTNQTGFDAMDSETDAIGRPMLAANITNPAQMTFNGVPIVVFPDAQLANVSSKAPIFYGSLKAGAYYIEKMGLEFAVSEHALFGKNQTALRVIEGFDVIQADTDAYIYGTYEPADKKTVTTETKASA